MKKEIHIEGMHCEHCSARVEEVLSSLDGVKKVKVILRKGIAKISCDKDISDDTIKSAIEQSGFSVTKII